mmetsp:Transcript_16376/g.27712  ORF Transcript_16376/g.27712 Transcript_16376/m.27712 type:complete len:195 (+) Transcript_16376:1910-2494(+)
MMKLIDSNNNGFLSFKEFSSVFRPDMSDKLVRVPLNDTYYPNLFPSKEINKDNLDKQTKMQEAIADIRKSFQPDFDSQLVAPTRFSSKPLFGSTFVNFQQERGAPGFISEQQRLAKSTRADITAPQGGPKIGSTTLQRSGQSNIFTQVAGNSLNQKIIFQQEDKLKSVRLQEARIQTKRANMENLEARKALENR